MAPLRKAERRMGELYRLDFASGKSYIGVTRHTAAFRFAHHKRAAKKSSKGIVYNVWRRDGEPRLVVLAVVDNRDLYETERRAVAVFGTRYPLGYNMTDGGDVPPSLSPEVAQKIAMKLRGRTVPAEQRLRQSEAMRGRKRAPESVARSALARRGQIVSLETRAKQAAAKLGTKRTAEVRAKMSEAQRKRRAAEGCVPQRWRYA